MTAITTSPHSLIQTWLTFRPGDTSACRAGLRTIRLIHFLVGCSGPNGLVSKHQSKSAPASIADRFGKSGFFQAGSVHVAYGYIVEFFGKAVRKFVQFVFAPVLNLGVYVRRLSLFVRSLGFGEFRFKCSIMSGVCNLLASRKRGQILEPQVDSDLFRDWFCGGFHYLDNYIQIPITFGILGKVSTVFNFALWKGTGHKHFVEFAVVDKSFVCDFELEPFHWNPTQRLFTTISEKRPTFLLARTSVLLADSVDSLRTDRHYFAGANGQVVEIEGSRPFLAPLQRVFLYVIAVIPDQINSSGIGIEKPVEIFDTVSVSENHRNNCSTCGGAW